MAQPVRLVGDRAYDSDRLDTVLAEQGIEMIAPHRRNRSKPRTQSRRGLLRYKHRWIIERMFAWLQNNRKMIVSHERYGENLRGFLHLACIKIFLRRL